LVDILDPTETYSLAQFLADAYNAVEEVGGRGKLPLVTGGTPQYLRAFIEGWRTPEVPPDERLREALASEPPAQLLERLELVDPASPASIGPNPRRLIRALEVYAATGQPASEQRGKSPPPYRFLVLGLRQERTMLHARIEARARMMFANGLVEETRSLLDLDSGLPALSSIGYPEARAVLLGELSPDEAIERTVFATNRYVRHQETWFRRFADVAWFDSARPDFSKAVFAQVRAFLDG
jgi:tRNA dimethylallyltransferase